MYSMGKKRVISSWCSINLCLPDTCHDFWRDSKKHEWEIYMIDIYWNDYAGGFYDTCIRMHKSREEKTFLKVLIEVCIIMLLCPFFVL